MTQTLEALQQRKATFTTIRGIVHTMKTVSAINALPYEHAAESIVAYHKTVLDGLHAFVHKNGSLSVTPVKQAESVVVVFGSDHGLCGNYNQTLTTHLRSTQKDDGSVPRIISIGARMADALQRVELDPTSILLPPASVDGIGRLAAEVTTRLDTIRLESHGDDIEVSLAYIRRTGQGRQEPTRVTLLPPDAEWIAELAARPWKSRSLPHYRLTGTKLLAALLRSHLFSSLFLAAAEALVTENAARFALMQQAERSVDEHLEILKTQTDSARQSEITTELLDIITGFEALKKQAG